MSATMTSQRDAAVKRANELKAQLDKASKELETLKRKAAAHAPYILTDKPPPPPSKYLPDIPDRIRTLATMGLGESEWIAELGLDEATWREWKYQFSALNLAVRQARAAQKAFIDRQIRLALTEGRNTIQASVLKDLRAQIDSDEAADDPLGDASKLVKVDVS